MKRYKVKTNQLSDVNKGDVIESARDGFIHDGQYVGFDITLIEAMPKWFDILPEWDLVESAIGGRYYVSNGKTDIYKNVNGYHFAFTFDEADAICETLNNLEETE